MNKRIQDAYSRFKEIIYAEISKHAEGHGSAERLAALTDLLREVEFLAGRVSPPDPARVTPLRQQVELPLTIPQELPEFVASETDLVKRGRRQDGKSYYEQRVPWENVRRIAEAIDVKFGNRAFHPQALARELELPAYQIYAALRMFAVRNQIESPRRGAHRRVRGMTLLAGLDGLRRSLPQLEDDISRHDEAKVTEER